jgi:predicted Zn-dependent protease
MADAGYNPIELARFFEKLEEKAGRAGAIEEFLSDHPNPGNRIAAISDEVREMPRRDYVDDETGQLGHVREVVRRMSPPSGLATFDGPSFSLRYPQNWMVQRGDKPDAVTIGPRGGVLTDAVVYGLQADYFAGDTDGLIRSLKQANAEMHVAHEARNIEVAGQSGLLNTLNSRSPNGGGEVDVVVTVGRPQGLFYIVFVSPKAEFEKVQPVFEEVLRSVRFRQCCCSENNSSNGTLSCPAIRVLPRSTCSGSVPE